MPTRGLQTALILYQSGTLTLSQAAARAGRTESSFRALLDKYGIEHGGDRLVTAVDGSSVRAD
ncbi:hypothetical protein ACNS7O_06775 [Haloferacaceae archaeon DSL9]